MIFALEHQFDYFKMPCNNIYVKDSIERLETNEKLPNKTDNNLALEMSGLQLKDNGIRTDLSNQREFSASL